MSTITNGFSSTTPIRTAIIGCGRIAGIHVASIRGVPDAEVVAVCDLNEDAARKLAGEHKIAAWYTDARKMIEETRPNVIHIVTPPQSHLRLVELAAGYGCHCYVEKPFAANADDAKKIQAIAVAKGIRVCPGHNRLFQPEFQEAQRRIRAGEIGRVVSVRAEQGYSYEGAARAAEIPWSYLDDFGILDNLMAHPLYLATHFLAHPGAAQVHAYNLNRVSEAGVEEVRVMIPSREAAAEVCLTLNAHPERNRVEIMGTDGRIVVDLLGMSLQVTRRSGLPSIVSRFGGDLGTAKQLVVSTGATILGMATGRIKRYPGVRRLVAAFYGALREGAATPVSIEDGILNVTLLDGIKASCAASLKRRVTVVVPVLSPDGPRTLVTGATGFVGGRLVDRLAKDGISVRATTRLAARAREIKGVEWVRCELASDDDVRAALVGIDTVYHCAALVGRPSSLKEYEAVNVEGALRLARLSAEAGVKQFVYLSSIGVYAMPRARKPFIEESHPYDARVAERGAYTQTKLAAEKAILEFAATHPVPRIVVLRPGAIYGPGVELPVGRFKLPSSFARPVVIGGRRVPMPLAFVDNVVDAMVLAAGSDCASGRVFNIVDESGLDQGGVARALRQASDGKIRTMFLPYAVGWLLMRGVDLATFALKRQSGTAGYRLARTVADMRFRCESARGELGWTPRVSTLDGLTRTYRAGLPDPYPH